MEDYVLTCPICHAENIDEARTDCHSGWKNTPEYMNDCPGTFGKFPFAASPKTTAQAPEADA